MSYLVIVESPTKVHTIKSFLDKDYEVIASMGHLRDLPKSKLAVDVDNNFEPHYIDIKGKEALIKEIKKKAKKSNSVKLNKKKVLGGNLFVNCNCKGKNGKINIADMIFGPIK